MQFTLNTKIILIAVCLMLVACGLGLVECRQDSKAGNTVQEKKNPDISTTTSGNFQSYLAAVRSAMFGAFLKSGMIKGKPLNPTIEDIQRLSFILPGELGYNPYSTWAVFGEENGGRIIAEDFKSKADKIFPGGRFYITLSNKIEGLGSEKPELIAIFPHFPANMCDKAIGDVFDISEKGLKIPVAGPPNLSAPPIVADEKDMGIVPMLEGWPYQDFVLGCYRDQNDVHYYYQVLFVF